MHEVPWSLDKVFSCEEAALEVHPSVCVSVCYQVENLQTLQVKGMLYRGYTFQVGGMLYRGYTFQVRGMYSTGDIHYKWKEKRSLNDEQMNTWKFATPELLPKPKIKTQKIWFDLQRDFKRLPVDRI